MADTKHELISILQKKLLQWEGYKPPAMGKRSNIGLGPLENTFPNNVLPVNTVHEFVCASSEQAASSGGFITGIIAQLMQKSGVCVWVGRSQRLFAPALTSFGVEPHQVIFINLRKDKDTLWVIEEALKCSGLTAVVGELSEMDFKQSRRFQLAVEKSRVTGFVLRNASDKLSATACAARWQVRSLPSSDLNGLPGLGFSRWQVDLLKVRNGQTGSWQLEWQEGHFVPIQEIYINEERQAV